MQFRSDRLNGNRMFPPSRRKRLKVPTQVRLKIPLLFRNETYVHVFLN